MDNKAALKVSRARGMEEEEDRGAQAANVGPPQPIR